MLHAAVAVRLQALGVEAGADGVEDGEVGARDGDAGMTPVEEVCGGPQLLVSQLELRRRRVALALGGQSGTPSRSMSATSGRSWARQRA